MQALKHNAAALQEAVERALEDNAELKAEMGETALRAARAAAAKDLGNDAFKARDYEEAVRQYSVAIAAVNTDPAFYSNRCAPSSRLTVLLIGLPLLKQLVCAA